MKKVEEYIKATAREREKAVLLAGKCTSCGNEQLDGNFCAECGATFLTDEEMAP
jgi:hypothetical protein